MNEQDSIFYIHEDHLGSFDVISNPDGTVKERYNYEPWGRRRNPADWSYNNVPEEFFLDRGFTGHQHLDQFGLINMNGRVYDPLMAMFLSPDNFVQSPDLTQNLNRYTYCLNIPLKFADPSGETYKAYMDANYGEGNYWYRGQAPGTWTDWQSYHHIGGGGGGYFYNSYTGQYKNEAWETVDYSEVHNNYIIPNSIFTFSGQIAQDLVEFFQETGSGYLPSKSEFNAALTAGPGGAIDVAFKIANTLNEFNPVAQFWDVIAYALTGKDRFGNSMNLGQGMLKAATIIPIGKIGSLVGQEGKLAYELIYRSKLGADGGISRHVIEKLDGLTISKTHQVFLEGKIIHQHQLHIGTYGTTRYFPEKWLNFPTIK